MSFFIIWLGVMFPLVFSPGPANIVFAASGAQVGLKRSMPLVAGVDTVFVIKSLLIGYGLAEFVQSYQSTMHFIQLFGLGYLLYLSYTFLVAEVGKKDSQKPKLGFVNGLVIQLLNSKGWLMVFLMFTLFSEQAEATFDSYSTLVLVTWLAILNVSTHIIWVALGDLLSKVSDHANYERALNIIYSLSLCGVCVWLAAENPLLVQLFVDK